MILAVTLVLLPDRLTLLGVANTSSALIVILIQSLLHILLIRPFAGRFDHYEALIVEACTFAVYSLACSFLFDFSSTRELLGAIGKWTVLLAIGGNAAMSVLRTVGLVAGLVKAYAERRKAMKYQMHGNAELPGAVPQITT